jgi:hypothetical protein
MAHRFLYLSIVLDAVVLASSDICSFPSTRPHNPQCSGPPKVYIVEPSRGKGLGVFATHDLDVGDIIMQEPPILKITPPALVPGSGYPMSEVSKLVLNEFTALPHNQQEEIMSLTYPAEDTQDKLGTIFKNNAYNTGTQVGLFPLIARINHSCRPNTSYYWSEKLNKRIVYATREIKQGEEFSVSYIPLLLARQQRQNLLARYGFSCACEACAKYNPDSDDRRLTLKKAFVDFEPQLTLEHPTSKEAVQAARNNAAASLKLTELVHQEGLADYYAKAYRIAAISHARVRDWQPAAVWANRGYELKYIEDPESVFTAEMHNLTSRFIASWEGELQEKRREG